MVCQYIALIFVHKTVIGNAYLKKLIRRGMLKRKGVVPIPCGWIVGIDHGQGERVRHTAPLGIGGDHLNLRRCDVAILRLAAESGRIGIEEDPGRQCGSIGLYGGHGERVPLGIREGGGR